MLNLKKRLCIEIEEIKEDEDEIQFIQVTKESNGLKLHECLINIENQIQIYEEERHKILDYNHIIANQILNYMEGENNQVDLSYKWYHYFNILRLFRVNILTDIAKSIFISQSYMDKLLNKRDIHREFKVR
jgi:hypothetical protein